MPTYVIHPITLCRAQAEKSLMTYMAHQGEKIWRPYIFFLVEGQGGRFLVDTAIEAAQYQSYRPFFQKVEFQPLLSFDQALARRGLTPADIELVIQTHLHFDHCYNTARCGRAKVVVQARELAFARDPHPVQASMYRRELFEGLDLQVVDGPQEILPGVSVLPSPGHTPGGQSVLVDTAAGRAAICGFCCIQENFSPPADLTERLAPFASQPVVATGIHVDPIAGFESVAALKKMSELILPLHEPALMEVESVP